MFVHIFKVLQNAILAFYKKKMCFFTRSAVVVFAPEILK